jgi:diguanylate cyclase (GGDEF)-like protein
MKLKTQILLSILGVTVLAQIVFGLLAYRQIIDSRADQQTIFLHRFAGEMAENLVLPESREDYDGYLEQLRQKFLTQRSVLYLQKDGAVLYKAGEADLSPDVISQKFADTHTDENQHGLIEIAGHQYYWAISPLPDAQYELVMLESASDDETNIASTLRLRLISSGLVILWVAVWIGLILSSKISRELDKKNEELKHLALHDTLTGLPNRTLLNDRIDRVLSDSQRYRQSFALFVIDLDRFKEINDTLGHQFGDELLKLVSVRLKDSVRVNDSIARLGGDEFAVLLPHTGLDGAELCVKRILQSMNKPIVINNITTESKASIGIALYPEHGQEVDELLKYADIAMYQAKQSQSGFALYDQEQNIHSVRRFRLMNDLRDAIDGKKIYLHYQPIVDASTGKIVHLEALARWNHPELGNIPPDEFISMVEQMGLINILTMQVLDQSLKDLSKWNKQGYDLGVSVNLSVYSLQNLSLPDDINALLNGNGVAAEKVQLEITETALMHDLSRAGNILNILNELGLRLAIDDFGTGFSSLNYLKKLPVDALKIDKSFISDMCADATDRAVVKTIIELGHNLGCHVVAEGVEDQATLDLLRQMEVDNIQGYFISKPIGKHDIELWLQDQK